MTTNDLETIRKQIEPAKEWYVEVVSSGNEDDLIGNELRDKDGKSICDSYNSDLITQYLDCDDEACVYIDSGTLDQFRLMESMPKTILVLCDEIESLRRRVLDMEESGGIEKPER